MSRVGLANLYFNEFTTNIFVQYYFKCNATFLKHFVNSQLASAFSSTNNLLKRCQENYPLLLSLQISSSVHFFMLHMQHLNKYALNFQWVFMFTIEIMMHVNTILTLISLHMQCTIISMRLMGALQKT